MDLVSADHHRHPRGAHCLSACERYLPPRWSAWSESNEERVESEANWFQKRSDYRSNTFVIIHGD